MEAVWSAVFGIALIMAPGQVQSLELPEAVIQHFATTARRFRATGVRLEGRLRGRQIRQDMTEQAVDRVLGMAGKSEFGGMSAGIYVSYRYYDALGVQVMLVSVDGDDFRVAGFEYLPLFD